MKNTWQSSVYPDSYPDVTTAVSIEQEDFTYLFGRKSWNSIPNDHLYKRNFGYLQVHIQLCLLSILVAYCKWFSHNTLSFFFLNVLLPHFSFSYHMCLTEVSNVNIHIVELDLSWTMHDQSHYIIMASVLCLQLYGSWLAVEGSHPGTTPTALCSRTADGIEMLSWWAVDLTQRTRVARIQVFLNSHCGKYSRVLL